MRSVADDLRDETRRTVQALPADERVRLALRLGDADVLALSHARGIGTEEARAIIRRTRRMGRQASVANDD